MRLVEIDPLHDPIWQELVSSHRSDVFHSVGWLRVVARTYDFVPQAIVVLDETGRARSGIVYCALRNLYGRQIVSLPFSDFCDPLLAEPADWSALTEELLRKGCPVKFRLLHNKMVLDGGAVPPSRGAKWHCLDLRRERDEIWGGLHGSARRAIRKAQRLGVVVKPATSKAELRAFYDMHLRTRKYKYQLLAQPFRFFENIWDQFLARQQGVLMLAHHQEGIVGGALFLEWQGKLYYKFNASEPTGTSVRPNDLLLWEGVVYGTSKGHTYLDFGLSASDQEGLQQFKRKYATEERDIEFLLLGEPGGQPPQMEEDLRILVQRLIVLFVDESVPDEVSEGAGDLLYELFA